MIQMREDSIMMNIYGILLYKDLTNKEIREKYKEKFKKSLPSKMISQYLYRLKNHEFIKVVGKKKGKNIYRNKDRQNYIAIIKAIKKLNDKQVPYEVQRIIYELIIKLLPSNVEELLFKILKFKTKEIRQDISIIDNEMKKLMYS